MASGRLVAQALRRSRILPRLLDGGGAERRHFLVQCNDSELLHGSRKTINVWTNSWRAFASSSAADDRMSLQDPDVKGMPGHWVVKGLVLAMLTYIGMNVTPMMGDSMVRQSVALVRLKDPFLKRSGASRLSLIATDDAKRKRIVDAGGVTALMGMLETASDDDTRKEAVKALAMLAHYDPAVEAMHEAGWHPLVLELASDSNIQEHTSVLLEKMDQWKVNRTP